MNRKLRRAILSALGTVAVAGLATEASAMSYHDFPLGSLVGKQKVTRDTSTPKSAYTSYKNRNHGWFHTAHFYRFTVGNDRDLAQNRRYTVTITMEGRDRAEGDLENQGPMQFPSFSVWSMGQTEFRFPDSTCHSWAQLRGPNDDVDDPLSKKPGKLPDGQMVTANNVDRNDKAGLGDGDALNPTPNGIQDGCLLYVGVVDGHDGWVGYAYTGPDVDVNYLGDGLNNNPQTKYPGLVQDRMLRGWFVNHQSPYVSGARSRGEVIADQPHNMAKLVLKNVKPGNYLIGAGGGCAFEDATADCSDGELFTMSVETKRVAKKRAAASQ